jgi:hypothetical protein
MKLFKQIFVFFFFPYPVAILGAFIGASFINSVFEGTLSEWPASSLGEETTLGYLVCISIIFIVQLLLGTLPLYLLRLFRRGFVGYMLSGLSVASITAGTMTKGQSSREFLIFAFVLFFLVILGYYFAYKLLGKFSCLHDSGTNL